MKDLDIVAITEDGIKIMAQVTFSAKGSSSVVDKVKKLRNYLLPSTVLIMFCQCDQQGFEDDVIFVPLDSVFREFQTTAAGKIWLLEQIQNSWTKRLVR